MRFRSKIDLWILVLLVMVLVVQSYVLFTVVFNGAPWSAKYTMIGTTVLVFSLIASILMRTYYLVEGGQLKIVCGPIWRTIDIADIQRITETRNPLSSPALSLDRLKIEYGRGKSIMISPNEKKDFLKAIGIELG